MSTCSISWPAASEQDNDVNLTAKVRIASAYVAVMDLDMHAQDDVLGNYAYEAVRCLVYQIMSSGGLVGSENEQHIENTSILLYSVAGTFMERDVLNARIQIEFESMMEDKLRRDLKRVSVLVAEVGRMCKTHVEKPEERIVYWRRELGY